MTDIFAFKQLCMKNNMDYYSTELYSTDTNEICGWAVWLNKGGHVEFDLDGMLTNIVAY